MNKILRYSLVCLLTFFCGSMFAETFTIDGTVFSSYTDDKSEPKVATSSPFTFFAAKNDGSTAPTYNANGKDVRLYAKGTFTISTSGDAMTMIVFNISTQGLKRLAPITASTGTIATQAEGDDKVTWTGSAKEVTFTVGDKSDYGTDEDKAGQLDFTSIIINTNGTSGGGDAETVPAPTITGTTPFDNSTEVTIDGGNYEICYTTDGSTPTANSTSAQGSVTFTITETTTVKAICVSAATGKESAVTTKTFKKNEQSSSYTMPAADSQLDVPTAWNAIDQGLEEGKSSADKYYVSGTITSIDDISPKQADGSGYGNATFSITDAKGSNYVLLVYRAKGFNNAEITDENFIKEGDNVTVYGKLQKYKDSKTGEIKYEISSCYITKVNGNTGESSETLEAGSIGRLTDDMNNKNVKLTLNNAEVVHAWTSNNGNTQVFVRDKTAACQFYNIGIELAKGDILNGSITAKYTLYNGNPEMTIPVADNSLSISKGPAEPQPQKITIADAKNSKNYLCDLVEISNVSLIPDPESSAKGTRAETTKYYIVDDSDNQLQIYNGFHDSAYDDLHEFLDQTDKTTIKGIIISTKTDPELYIVEIVTPAGVNGITADTKANGPIYNVAGQRVNKAVKGVYIQNGKKFVVK